MSLRLVLAVVLALALLPASAPAQSANPAADTQLRLEMQRKRLIVRPDANVGGAVHDSERAADAAAAQAAAAAAARDAGAPWRHQLDPDVTNAIQQNAVRGLRR